MIKIKYKKKRLKGNLNIGLFFSVMGIILMVLYMTLNGVDKYPLDTIGIADIGAGISLLFIYFYKKKKQYLNIENGFLIKNSLIPKKIKLTEIKSAKKVTGNYEFQTNKKKLIVDTEKIDWDSLIVLNKELDKLNLSWR